MENNIWGIGFKDKIKKIDISNKDKDELFFLIYNDKELNPKLGDMGKLKKEVDKRYIYSEEQWKNVLQERSLMGQRI